MLKCLICRSKLIEAFQHFQYRFLICRTCFMEFLQKYHNNAFLRISILGKEIPAEISIIQARLLKFIEMEKISIHNIFNFTIFDLYQTYITQKNEAQDLSTEYSFHSSTQYPIEQRSQHGFYENYNWVKEKLIEKYNEIKANRIGSKVTENVIPVKEQIIQKSSTISSKFHHIKNQFNSFKREAPSLSEIKKLNISGFFKSKYKDIF